MPGTDAIATPPDSRRPQSTRPYTQAGGTAPPATSPLPGRPKSANPSYEQAGTIRVWARAPQGTVTTQTTYTGVGFGTGQKGPGGVSLSEGFLETTRKTITEESEVLWAYSSNGLDDKLIARPKTSNPTYISSCSTPPASRRRSDCPSQPSLSAEEVTPSNSNSAGVTELLWAEHSPAPASMVVARPGTANPNQDSFFSDTSPTQAEAVHIVNPKRGVSQSEGVLWSSDGNMETERPSTFNTQLASRRDSVDVPPPDECHFSEVLWSRDGAGVTPELVARPKAAPNKQLESASFSDPNPPPEEREPSHTDVWKAEDLEETAEHAAARPHSANPWLEGLLHSSPTNNEGGLESTSPGVAGEVKQSEVLWAAGQSGLAMSQCSPRSDQSPAPISPNGPGPMSPAPLVRHEQPEPVNSAEVDALRQQLRDQTELIQRQSADIQRLSRRVQELEAMMKESSRGPSPSPPPQGSATRPKSANGNRVGALPRGLPEEERSTTPTRPTLAQTPHTARKSDPSCDRLAGQPARPMSAPPRRAPATPVGPPGRALRKAGPVSLGQLWASLAGSDANESQMRELFNDLVDPRSGVLSRVALLKWYKSVDLFGMEGTADHILSSITGSAQEVSYEQFTIFLLQLTKL
eukprot:Hpha_TRINITY_DN10566_c0_g1::TRINITY_DN10566_c0_g1_i1::g.31256::m.31256